jgi:hypothetical protein
VARTRARDPRRARARKKVKADDPRRSPISIVASYVGLDKVTAATRAFVNKDEIDIGDDGMS